jgi:hypothetical protein
MKNQNHVIFVNPVKRQSPQGRHNHIQKIFDPETRKQIGSYPRNLSKGAAVTDRFKFPINFETKRVVSGLDELITNPFYGKTPGEIITEYNLDKTWEPVLEGIVKREQITKQREYEIRASVAPDTYTSNAIGTTMLDSDRGIGENAVRPTELQKFMLILYQKNNRFDSSTARGRLAIQLCKNHPRIANSINDVNPNIHLFYIASEHEEREKKVALQKRKQKIGYIYNKLVHEFTPIDAYKIAIVLKDQKGQNILKGDASPERVESVLLDFIDEKNKNFLVNGAELERRVKQLQDAEGNMELDIDYVIQQGINGNVFHAGDGYINWVEHIQDANVGTFSDMNKLRSFLLDEYKKYSPKSKTTNWYGVLVNQLKERNLWKV